MPVNFVEDSINPLTTLDNLIIWLLIIGTFLSYIPQFYFIYKQKSIIGISEMMLIFGVYAGIFNVFGSIQEKQYQLDNCGELCYDVSIPIIQLGAPLICGIIFYVFFVFFYPYDHENMESKKIILQRMYINLFFFMMVLFYCGVINSKKNYPFIVTSGKVFNIISSLFCFMTWIPQVYNTYILKGNGNLSLITLSINSAGCLLTVIYQSSLQQPVWIILPYLISFVLEVLIVLLSLHYSNKIIKDERNYQYIN